MAFWFDLRFSQPTEQGAYEVRFVRDGEVMQGTKKLFIGSIGELHWMGGMRPFCENDVVTHYRKRQVDLNKIQSKTKIPKGVCRTVNAATGEKKNLNSRENHQ